ncbi:hypothetical protein CH293_09920 [Rhodococcus sp. 14-2470-1b]|uniref:hypothetical protein n=1 Tax=Rhodococcus sp. 14-2470-1b TaxID=2023149 RepID=UPI000B9C1DEE|nr:hypothetical protein [Rhodococcus sp. 14-2470-1b]OZF54866.1 hypothetical protein CH293_09305 [Rhodococcus sp. 14-2470-1b]OZF54978.1 hypothetical protein CH293_09920 [Rhodococcus sp. 14-2470-1b]
MSSGSPTPDLPGPEAMRGRWALCAALTAAQGWPDHCHARPGSSAAPGATWHYDDGGGNWAALRIAAPRIAGLRIADASASVSSEISRAVLVGYDHEYSETYFGAAAEYFGEPETDLLRGLPAWTGDVVADYIADIQRSGMWLGFVYVFDKGRWSRAAYSAPDGFAMLNLPPVSAQATTEHLAEFLNGIAGDQGVAAGVDATAVAAAVAAGPAVTSEQLRAMFGARQVDIEAGVAAARLFA